MDFSFALGHIAAPLLDLKMPLRPSSLMTRLFWLAFALVHALALAGYVGAAFPINIAGEGVDMLGTLDLCLALLFAITRLWRASLGAALLGVSSLAMALAPPMLTMASAPFPALAGSPSPIRLLQANIMSNGLPLASLSGHTFDVATIAEWRKDDDDSWARSMGLHLVAFKPGHGDAALFSRWPAIASGCVPDDEGWCQAVWALLDTPAGHVRIISLHTLSPQQAWRVAGRDRFFARLESFIATLPPQEPLIAAGDFNATWGAPSMRHLGSAALWNSETRRAPSWPSFSSKLGLGFRIDHQLAAKGALITQQEIFDSGYSDHLWTSALVHLPHPVPGPTAQASASP
jgi:endonuclease/exonuclease/phosphatase family metal-dependent hydrolase